MKIAEIARMIETGNSSTTLQVSSPEWVEQIRSAYGSAEQLLTIFNPSKQTEYCSNIDRCFTGNAPSIRRVSIAYSENIAETWLEIQLKDLSDYAGCREKLSVAQMEEMARMITIRFGHLKLTELMMFFVLLKSGRFGKFYGSIDPMMIMASLSEFMTIRANKIDEIEERDRIEARKNQVDTSNCITYSEWKKKNNIEDLK